jgi:excisionase family DNA binding protein
MQSGAISGAPSGLPDNGIAPVPDRLLDSADVALWLNTSRRWVDDAARRGELPSVKIGRVRRFRQEEIRAWIEAL